MPKLVCNEKPSSLAVKRGPQKVRDVVPSAAWSWIDRYMKGVVVDRDQQGLRTPSVRIELCALDQESVAQEPRLEVLEGGPLSVRAHENPSD